jgi:hypothetical protein
MLIARHGAVVGRTKAIGHLKALIVNAPQQLREQLRRGTTDQQLDAAPGCAQRRRKQQVGTRPVHFSIRPLV